MIRDLVFQLALVVSVFFIVSISSRHEFKSYQPLNGYLSGFASTSIQGEGEQGAEMRLNFEQPFLNTGDNGEIPKDAVKGDYNGDGLADYAWLVPPKKSECKECFGNCTSYIRFSDKSIPSIKVEMCVGGTLSNLGDLNKNISDEIGILPGWCTSCWRAYKVYTLKKKEWIFAVEPFSTHCNQWENDITPVEIDKNKEGYVLIRFSELTDDDIVTKTKSVPVK